MLLDLQFSVLVITVCLFVFFIFCPLHCLSFFDFRLFVTSLISSNFLMIFQVNNQAWFVFGGFQFLFCHWDWVLWVVFLVCFVLFSTLPCDRILVGSMDYLKQPGEIFSFLLGMSNKWKLRTEKLYLHHLRTTEYDNTGTRNLTKLRHRYLIF